MKTKIGQDGKVERFWAHFLLQAHQNHNYLQSNYIRMTWRLAENILNKKIQKDG